MTWAKKIYAATTTDGIYFTDNFVIPQIQPIWQKVNNGLESLACREFHLDPFHQEERQYVLMDGYNALYRREMEGDWQIILSYVDFASLCVPYFISSSIRGFCADPIIEGRLWVAGQIYVEAHHYYGSFGYGPYFQNRFAYSDDYGESWTATSYIKDGWSIPNISSLRSYGDTVYAREGGATFDHGYLMWSQDKANLFYITITDVLEWTLGGFLNPLTPNRFYYDTKESYNEFTWFEDGAKYSINGSGFQLGNSRWDTIWYNESNGYHMKLINQNKLFVTYDNFGSVNSPSSLDTIYDITSISPYAGDNSDYILFATTYQWGYSDHNPLVFAMYGEDNIEPVNISGTNWNTSPYTDSIPYFRNICRCGLQGVKKSKGYIYVNGIAMPEFSENTGGGTPMEGDRSAWNARYYASLHANDINLNTSSLHHSLGAHIVDPTSGSFKFAPGDHTHYLHDLSSGSSNSGEILTSLGTGSPTWLPLADHLHSGSTTGDGGQFNADHLSSGSAIYNTVLTYDSGTITWKKINEWRLSIIEDTTTNNSSKQFLVPTGEELQILWIWVEYTSTSTAGLRRLEIQLKDASDNIINTWQTGVEQDSSLTYKYYFGLVVPDLTSPRDSNYIITPLPTLTILNSEQKIRVWDKNSVDTSGDDMIIRIQYSYQNI